MFWTLRGHRPPAGGVFAMLLFDCIENVHEWHRYLVDPRGYIRITDKGTKLL